MMEDNQITIISVVSLGSRLIHDPIVMQGDSFADPEADFSPIDELVDYYRKSDFFSDAVIGPAKDFLKTGEHENPVDLLSREDYQDLVKVAEGAAPFLNEYPETPAYPDADYYLSAIKFLLLCKKSEILNHEVASEAVPGICTMEPRDVEPIRVTEFKIIKNK